MKLDLLVRTSASALYANKTRSGLTILGIVIGITAIILIFSLGAGAERNHEHNGRNADHNAKNRQRRARAVGF